MPEMRHQFQVEPAAELRDADGQVLSIGKSIPLSDYGRFLVEVTGKTPLATILRSATILVLPGAGLKLGIREIRENIEEVPHTLSVFVTTSLSPS